MHVRGPTRDGGPRLIASMPTWTGFADVAAVLGSLSAAATEIARALVQTDQISQAAKASACTASGL